MSGHDHDHDSKSDEAKTTKPAETFSRRDAARHSLKVLLTAGASLLGLVMASQQAKAGYGACSISGCPCQAYMGGGDLCQNCGHQYGMHW